jgi:hypothetical protein
MEPSAHEWCGTLLGRIQVGVTPPRGKRHIAWQIALGTCGDTAAAEHCLVVPG